jgi:MFS family permease
VATPSVASPALSGRGGISLRAAFAISTTGDWIYKFAVPTLILRLTGSPIATAFAYVLEFIPYVLVGPFGGVLADRLPRRTTMVGCDAISAVLALGIAGLAQLGHAPVAALYLCALALACVRPVYFPALQGFLVEAVAEHQRPRFNSWTQVTDGMLSIAGPVLGTTIVGLAGVPTATVIDAASFAASALLVATIRIRRPPRAPGPGAAVAEVRAAAASEGAAAGEGAGAASVLRDLAAGFRALTLSRAILIGTILITGANLAANIIEGNLVYLVLAVQHHPKVALGAVFSAQGIGAIAGAFIAPRLLGRQRTGRLLAAGLGMSFVAMAIPAAFGDWASILAGQGIEGAATALIVVCWFTALQRVIPAGVIGRFVAVGRAIAYATIPAGALLGGWLLTLSASTRLLFGCAAAVELVIFAVSLRSALMRIDDEPTAQPQDATAPART